MADKKVALFNPNDGLVGRDGGPYLDLEEARNAEKRRAEVEGRKPNLDEPSATAGLPLVTAGQILHTATTLNIPSRDGTAVLDDAAQEFAKSEKVEARVMSEVSAENIGGSPEADAAEKKASAPTPRTSTTKKAAAKTATAKK